MERELHHFISREAHVVVREKKSKWQNGNKICCIKRMKTYCIYTAHTFYILFCTLFFILFYIYQILLLIYSRYLSLHSGGHWCNECLTPHAREKQAEGKQYETQEKRI